MKKLIFILLFIIECSINVPIDVVEYDEIQGTWALTNNQVIKWDSSHVKLYSDYREFFDFSNDSVYRWYEKYFFDSLGIVTSYRYTERWRGYVYYIGKCTQNTDAYGKYVVNISWKMIDTSGNVVGDGYVDHMVLRSLYNDTLDIGYAMDDNAFTSGGSCYISLGKLVRFNIEPRKNWWKYLR